MNNIDLIEESLNRSQNLVSAARVFNAFLRVARNLHVSPTRAAVSANAVAEKHTGIDVLSELGIEPIDAVVADELLSITSEGDTLASRLADWLQDSSFDDVTTDEAILGLGLSIPDSQRRGAQVRIGRLMIRLGWKKIERRGNYSRRMVYQRPAGPSRSPKHTGA